MRVIISGGGTGGHIYPAITIARVLAATVEKNEPCEILFVGTKEGLEADIIPKEGFRFATIEVQGFSRKLLLKNVKVLGKTFIGLWQARRIVSDFKPDLVIGTGGYVCGPVLLAASLKGVPAIVQEQNVVAGVTNRILAKFVRKIAVGYAEAREHFDQNMDKVVVTGNPIRAEVLAAKREDGLAALGLNPAKRTILVSGGSRGARSINQAMLAVHKHFAGSEELQILHVTGQAEYNSVIEGIRNLGIDIASTGNIIIKPYLYDMPQGLAAADLAVFRAGAIGLAELTVRGVPAILIPYPYAAENHQEFNAKVMEKHGAAVVIPDAGLTGELLIATIERLIADNAVLKEMAAASKELGRPEAAQNIVNIALQLLANAR